MELELELRRIMEAYLKKNSRLQANIHNLGDSLQIRTTTPVLSNPYGRRKFHEGLDTVWLQIKKPNYRPVIIARLSEEYDKSLDFQVFKLEQYEPLIKTHLQELKNIIS